VKQEGQAGASPFAEFKEIMELISENSRMDVHPQQWSKPLTQDLGDHMRVGVTNFDTIKSSMQSQDSNLEGGRFPLGKATTQLDYQPIQVALPYDAARKEQAEKKLANIITRNKTDKKSTTREKSKTMDSQGQHYLSPEEIKKLNSRKKDENHAEMSINVASRSNIPKILNLFQVASADRRRPPS
jgi:hypothetical protein